MAWRFVKCVKTFRDWPRQYLDRWGIGAKPGEERTLHLRNGLTLTVRSQTSDFRTSRSIFLDESYLIPPLAIPEDAVVVDVGAHIGCFTLFAAARAKRGQIFSFEPEPSNFRLLEENVRRNGLDHVRCFPMAVAGSAGERRMERSGNPRTTGGGSLFGGGGEAFTVACADIPGIMRDHGLERIDFLKLDCEGAEWEILESMPIDALRRIRQMAMEIHNPPEDPPAFRRLRENGFVDLPHPKRNYRAFHRPTIG